MWVQLSCTQLGKLSALACPARSWFPRDSAARSKTCDRRQQTYARPWRSSLCRGMRCRRHVAVRFGRRKWLISPTRGAVHSVQRHFVRQLHGASMARGHVAESWIWCQDVAYAMDAASFVLTRKSATDICSERLLYIAERAACQIEATVWLRVSVK